MSRDARTRPMLLTLGLITVVARTAPAAEPDWRWLLTAQSGADLYLSEARSLGGLGGGLGLRAEWKGPWVFEGNFGPLVGAGAVLVLRLAAGIQRPGSYCPALLFGTRWMFGDALHFVTPAHRLAPAGPAFSFGPALSPLRFRKKNTELSFASVYWGLGSDLPGLGTGYGITLLEVGTEL